MYIVFIAFDTVIADPSGVPSSVLLMAHMGKFMSISGETRAQ